MIDNMLQQAADSYSAGDHRRAEALCEEVLARAPRNSDALHLLGVLRLSGGNPVEAIRLLRGAVEADDGNLGALDTLGAALLTAGDYPQAEEIIRRLIAAGGTSPVANMHLGVALASQRKWDEAMRCFEEAVRGAPDHPNAHYNLGNALMELHRPQDALVCFERTLALDPAHANACNAAGTALYRLGKTDEAIASYRRALALESGHALAEYNLGSALLQHGDLEQAGQSFRRVIALQPGHAMAYCGVGTVLQEQRRLEEALRFHEQALALDGNYAEAQYNVALIRLFQQEFGQAWPLYEQRLNSEGIRQRLRKRPETVEMFERLPRWRGPDEAGAGEVAIWAEQGIGEQVLFSTLIPELIAAEVPFLYEVDRRLLGAYQRAFPGVRFIAWQEPPQEAAQRAGRVALSGSLPGLFRRSRGDFARQPAKLLSALPERVAHYRQRLAAPGLKVALSWRSTRKDWWVQKKSALLADFTPLLKLPGVQFMDVQYGDTTAERSAVEATAGVRLARFDEVDYFNDLEELLAILEACDLLITSSNATAHFAGALGKRTWLLYPAERAPFHYWAHGGNYRSLWYPSVEIVTMPQLADWVSLIGHAAEKLKRVFDF